jgi:hypothetical protein
MNRRATGCPCMETTFTLTQDRIIQIIARTLGCTPAQVKIDPTEDGFGVAITSEDPHAPGRVDNLFKRWAKQDAAAASDPKAN